MRKNREKKYRILIAGGGTGGHLFPGLAIAEAFLNRFPQTSIRFAGSSYGLEHRVVPEKGFPLYRLPVRGLYGVSWRQRLWVLAMFPFAFMYALWILLTFRPHLVIGVGGYASGPVLATAILLRKRTAIQEQNAYPGMTNRLLGRFVRIAFVPVEGLEALFPRNQVVGNPVRRDILALRTQTGKRQPAPKAPLVFIMGGSQGAHRINQAMIDAVPHLTAWKDKLKILHQTGTADRARVEEAYKAGGLTHQATDFLEDMAGAYNRARLVVSRSGASALTEILTARRGAVLIPIPGTSGEHQLKNALRVAEAGAGQVLEQKDLTGESLAQAIIKLLEKPEQIDAMEEATDKLYEGDSAGKIVEAALKLIG